MRVISSDGKYDLPYEKCCVWTNKFNNVMASPSGEPGSEFTMATYSTPEKAEKTMQILHEAYIVNENFKKMDAKLQLQMLGCANAETRLKYGGIFQFPKEEDLP